MPKFAFGGLQETLISSSIFSVKTCFVAKSPLHLQTPLIARPHFPVFILSKSLQTSQQPSFEHPVQYTPMHDRNAWREETKFRHKSSSILLLRNIWEVWAPPHLQAKYWSNCILWLSNIAKITLVGWKICHRWTRKAILQWCLQFKTKHDLEPLSSKNRFPPLISSRRLSLPTSQA